MIWGHNAFHPLSGAIQAGFQAHGKARQRHEKLRAVIEKLVNATELEARYKDHSLRGQYVGARDCHISPDWVLIYAIVENELRLIRTGTHADLFK